MRGPPAFPPDIAASLQYPEGRASVRYTAPANLAADDVQMDRLLMCTPHEGVVAALVLDTKLTLRFVRTGSAREGARIARIARADASNLVYAGTRHWDITMTWDPDHIAVEVRDQHPPPE